MSNKQKHTFFPNLDMDRIKGLIGLIEANDVQQSGEMLDEKALKLDLEQTARRRKPSVETLLRHVLNN